MLISKLRFSAKICYPLCQTLRANYLLNFYHMPPQTQHVQTITYYLLSLNFTSSSVLYLRTGHHQQSNYIQIPLL